MKNFLIATTLIANSGCGVLMTVAKHEEVSQEREREWVTSWNKLKNVNEALGSRVLTAESELKLKKDFVLALQKTNTKITEKLELLKRDKELLRRDKQLDINRLENEVSLKLEKIRSLNNLVDELRKVILRKENEYISLEKSKRKFKCQSWECFKAAVNGSDNFWDKYASQAEDFLGKSPHRKLLEKERKSVLRNWTKGYKLWKGVRRTYFDWVSGDRRKTFVAVLGRTYRNGWDSLNDFEMSGEIRIEVKSKKDQAFFDEVNSGAWKIIAYVKIKKKIEKDCFWGKCTANWVITKSIKKIEFLPDTENFNWDGKPRKKVFGSKKFVHVQ